MIRPLLEAVTKRCDRTTSTLWERRECPGHRDAVRECFAICHRDRRSIEVAKVTLGVGRKHRKGSTIALIPELDEIHSSCEVGLIGESRHADSSL